MSDQIKKILLPKNPHLDPLAACYLLFKYGEEKFSGISSATLEIWPYAENPSRDEIARWQEEGILTLDVGGGLFDHHQTKKDVTSTFLAAEYLGLAERPEIQELIRYVQEDDLYGLHNRWGDLAQIIKCFNKAGYKLTDIVNFVFNILEALQAKEEIWHADVKEEFEAKAQIQKIKRGKNKVKIAIIESDNLYIAAYGRENYNLAMVIQKNSKGHVFIFTNKIYKINLTDLAGAVRLRELEELNLYNPQKHQIKNLKFPGKHADVPGWFYHKSLNALMNGSFSLSETKPTKLAFSEIIDLTLFAVGSDFPEQCLKVKENLAQTCQSCKYNRFEFYKCNKKRELIKTN